MAALLLSKQSYSKVMLKVTLISSLCRVYALFVADKVCAEPLTDAVHFNDLMHANPSHVEATARLLKSPALAINKLYSEMHLLRKQQPPLQRSANLKLGVPYPLHDTLRCVLSCLGYIRRFTVVPACALQQHKQQVQMAYCLCTACAAA